ncbi:MAG: redoxin domain-containing protein [Phycisphaera sp.]|nr:redoxin domain-containing protein [Phycisphaera sp.]
MAHTFNRRAALTSVLTTLVLSATLLAQPTDVTPIGIGDAAPNFDLPGVDGKRYSLASFKDAKLLAVIFTCDHCPTAQAYEQRIIALHKDYADKGVAIVAVSPNDAEAVRLDELGYTDLGDSLEDMKLRAKEHGFKFPYLYAGDQQEMPARYGAKATPHVMIFDADRKLRFNGRIDDSDDPSQITSRDTRAALDALLAGKDPPAAKTKVFGCSVKWSDKRAHAAESLAKWNTETAELNTLDEAGVKKLVANDTDKYCLINVWATWCGPCVAEMPDLVEMHRMYRKRPIEIVTISADKPEQIEQAKKFLNEQHASTTNYLFNGGNVYKLVEALDPKWEGPLPHTILVAPGGKIVYRHTGRFEALEVRRAIVEHIGRTYFSKLKTE